MGFPSRSLSLKVLSGYPLGTYISWRDREVTASVAGRLRWEERS